ncbi:pilus assembly protein [Luteimonas viscosa]|uniref:Pilus assembly protein n=2 Tax=Luteimonas viscosa TaxID=1132694 RepID=A0A5D4XSF7_9GAMM|nr:pilus assembly protein [Luteimonas viscosa]
MSACSGRSLRSRASAFLVGLLAVVSSVSALSVEIDQRPLYLGSDVPGNLALVPSVEYPTIHSQANIGSYATNRRYSGYFDPGKCYEYQYSATEAERHFSPAGAANGFNCTAEGQWSGNYLNWAATQTIDPFRSALTGGYRVKDEADETWLEKARHAPGYTLYPNRRLPNSGSDSALVENLTPASWNNLTVRIQGLGNKMRFSASGNLDSTPVPYNPEQHPLVNSSPEEGRWENCSGPQPGCVRRGNRWQRWVVTVPAVQGDAGTVYEVSVRVKVCDPAVGVEANCKQYSQGWKPEGLIQEYSERIRYSIFGFMNETGNQRNGGVMRARQKYVGPNTHYPELGTLANANREWDPETGVLVRNPDSTDATATGYDVADSGVINYLNKFGQMTAQDPKGNDPVSELYYAALRYFRGQGNLASYTSGVNYNRADGFPVITDWDDPIRYACQVNAALGIGDVYTHEDRNIPTTPADDLALARTYTQKIFDLESINKEAEDVFSGRGNSAYIAGLAYYANTNDLRPDNEAQANSAGRQTLSTYWVDVRENQRLEPKSDNQYWLAAKYGGFRAPEGFDPLETTGLNQAWWHGSNEYLVSGANGDVTTAVTAYPRPDNFYVASEADKMVASLREAFESFLAEMEGSASSFASNTTRLENGAQTYQAQFVTGQNNEWGGELRAFDVNVTTGALTETWAATDNFPEWGPTNATPGARQVFYNNGGTMAAFEGAVAGLSSEVVNYLRGDRSEEQSNGGDFRDRRSVLGDIVNSQPTFVGAPNGRLFAGQTFPGASAYAGFAAGQATRTPVIYVGANDGMLHAFNADTGAELFAFVPTEGMSKLHGEGGYTDPDYEHAYTVDGALTAADWFNGTSWRTVVVGTMGRGGKSVFALDVTDPASPSLLWERTASELGNNLGQPIVAQVASNDWRVLVGNGPNSSDGEARLVSIGLGTGMVSSITTGVGGDNGLSGINAWSTSGNGIFDTAYAGDLRGNLWKFNLAAGTATLLFAAGDSKPITVTPLVARNPRTLQTWLFFGTGRYLNSADLSNKDVQTWYGLIDRGVTITDGLAEVEVLDEGVVGGRDVRVIEQITTPGTNGWQMDLLPPGGVAQGERMVVPNFFQGLALIGTTRIPDANDVCSPSGKGFTMAIDPFTGGRLSSGFFDVTGDGHVDAGDTLDGVPVSGIGYDSSPNNPIFLGDIMYTSLDDGGSAIIQTNASGSDLRRVSWRELIRN